MTAEEMAEEIRRTWGAARSVNGQLEAFRILERMVDRLGYGRLKNNPTLAPPKQESDDPLPQPVEIPTVATAADELMAEGIGELLDERLRELDGGEVGLVSSGVVMALATFSNISYEHSPAIDLRVGKVLTCDRVPKKDRLLRLAVDVGEAEPRTIVAGLAQTFAPEQLVARTVVVVANLAPREFGKGLVSHGMLLATGPSDKRMLATVLDGKPGDRLK